MVVSFVAIFFASSYRNQLGGSSESCDAFSDDDLSRDAVIGSPGDTERVRWNMLSRVIVYIPNSVFLI